MPSTRLICLPLHSSWMMLANSTRRSPQKLLSTSRASTFALLPTRSSPSLTWTLIPYESIVSPAKNATPRLPCTVQFSYSVVVMVFS
ncbi:hypothetical protein IEQ34_004087 [Dendrobium chrysotoxum]|uniref:Secreted protein n=1 Tax=Dendrobium chrysotoxum TaxID=161865 RepID=A0AAV7HG92_DENCH|nr:hypothetical protein IEQ34_004087 [Dendrobium chrysotoxum]